MSGRADLHLHTTYSDGQLAPKDLVGLSVERGLQIIAVTDHNTTGGLTEALAAAEKHAGLQVIPGVELSTGVDGVHILGYFVVYELGWFQSELARIRRSQRQSIRETVGKLGDLGLHVAWRRVLEMASEGSVGRRHIALAMLEKGYVASIDEAFYLYLGRNGSVRTEMAYNLTPAEAVAVVVRANGLPVLAHPAHLPGLESLVVDLKGGGLVGLEAYCWGYASQTITRLLALARRHRLLSLGGSDFHGVEGIQGRHPGDVTLPKALVRRLQDLAARQQRPTR